MTSIPELTRAWMAEVEESLKRDLALEWDAAAAAHLVHRVLLGADARAAAREFATRRVCLRASESDVDRDLLALALVCPDDAAVGVVLCELREAAARGARRAATWADIPRIRASLSGLYNPHLLVRHLHRRLSRAGTAMLVLVRWSPAPGSRLDTSRLAVSVAVTTFATPGDLAATVGPSEIGLSSDVAAAISSCSTPSSGFPN